MTLDARTAPTILIVVHPVQVRIDLLAEYRERLAAQTKR
jgi:hypothetical protein